VDEEESELMASTLLRATVQIDAPMRRRIVPRMAKHVEITKKRVCLMTPLGKPSLGQQREANEREMELTSPEQKRRKESQIATTSKPLVTRIPRKRCSEMQNRHKRQ
jgi:hypothetical protein